MHPSPYIGAGSGYNRQFHYYSDVNYPPHDFNQYSQHHEKYWLGWPSMPTQVTIEPHDHDVLLGRGGRNNQHTGNDILRQFGRVQGENYRVASKKGKSAISRLLVRQMRELNPPARFLKRVQQTAAWEEVSEETAREKASQVLRDAVAGLLDRKSSDEDETVSFQPLPSISAPVSVDEQDLSPHSGSTKRKHQQHFYPPQPDLVQSERKRRRCGTYNSSDVVSSSRQRVVGCSPIRRHGEATYGAEGQDGIVYSHTSVYRPDGYSRTSGNPAHSVGQHHTGSIDELLHGELLESDMED